MEAYNDLINKIRREILTLFREILESDYALNKRSGTTLKVSHLSHDAEVKHIETNESNIFNLMYNDYLQYIESGRKPFVKKVPVRALIKWAKERGIPSDNKTIFAIRESIFKRGIAARKLLDPFGNLIDNTWDKKWADDIFNDLNNDLTKYFNNGNNK